MHHKLATCFRMCLALGGVGGLVGAANLGCVAGEVSSTAGSSNRTEEEDGGAEEAPRDPCVDGSRSFTPIAIEAAAPEGIDVRHLGRPLDANFAFLSGPDGETLFPEGDVFTSPADTIYHRAVEFDNSRSFSAHASAWGITVGGGTGGSRRYVAYQAVQTRDVRSIEDTTQIRTAPKQAVWYLSKIHYGHSYDLVISGEANSFHVSVKASFFGLFGGGMKAFAESHSLDVRAIGRGLKPKSDDAIFARSEDEIREAYTLSGDPVPILVEYRSIPAACIPGGEPIEWKNPLRAQIDFKEIDIYRRGDRTWNLDARCRVNEREVRLNDPIVWASKGSICDNRVSGRGPQGDGNYCRFDLGWSTVIDVIPGEIIRCGVEGRALPDDDAVDYAEFEYTVMEENEPVSDRVGTGNSHTEYWMNYDINFVPYEQNNVE